MFPHPYIASAIAREHRREIAADRQRPARRAGHATAPVSAARTFQRLAAVLAGAGRATA